MKKILFINYCIYLPNEKTIKRTFYLFEMMRKKNLDVTFLTSDFNHYEKKTREMETFFTDFPEYRKCLRYVHMEPYKKNISFKRFINNYACEKKIFEWFEKNGKDFDVLYISWPMYYLVNKLNKICKINNIKIILDINDLWPDSLKMIIGNDLIYNCMTSLLQKRSNRAISYADGLVAVSDEYLNMAIKVNRSAALKKTVYIGSMLEKFDYGVNTFKTEISKEKDEFWLIYIGTLGKSYDIDTVIKAVNILRKEYQYNIRFKILGQGPTKSDLVKLAFELDCDGIDFLGFLQYEEMSAYLSKSDICMNCLKPRASQSIINKIADYFASSNPVLNCGPCVEMKNLVEDFNTGINYTSENVDELVDVILKLYSDQNLRKIMGLNSRKLAEMKFNRKKTHQELIELIINL